MAQIGHGLVATLPYAFCDRDQMTYEFVLYRLLSPAGGRDSSLSGRRHASPYPGELEPSLIVNFAKLFFANFVHETAVENFSKGLYRQGAMDNYPGARMAFRISVRVQ